jgi:hypothetical protein
VQFDTAPAITETAHRVERHVHALHLDEPGDHEDAPRLVLKGVEPGDEIVSKRSRNS